MFGFFEKLLAGASRDQVAVQDDKPHQLAAAALLVEAATADGEFAASERDRISRLLVDRFGLGPFEAATLLEQAEKRAKEGSDWQGFTRVLKEAYGPEGRIAIVEMLWEVVLADGSLDDFEAALMRQLPSLLYVSDRENAEARARVRARLEAKDG
ncbi:Uncharacterized conserved protein, tellurite resistance protein B (TerB) family [Arboricoccus pini]|uniref:Uncharacterized conserved protein, tellurite resistance protein B (TerB) family n=1 Tax=Arboricoccus pini TaxID=1963835 RepID=A0A212RC34_9PROT|nr:TerB family tellurite resistance protein [Arboricoccus pini]SNB69615.1 Uncharacterized conserved protein, tellurite resistance protein B (TerB) family [Arboricoccus pini]